MNRGEIRDFIYRMAPETDATDAELNLLINEGQLNIAKWAQLIRTEDEQDGADSTADYDLPNDFLAFNESTKPTYNGKELKWKDMQWLKREYTDSLSTSDGEPLYITMNEDFTSVKLVPYPDEDNAGDGESLIIPCIIRPTDMSSDTTYPWNEISAFYPYHILIAWYVIELEQVGIGEYQRATMLFTQKYGAQLRELMLVANNLINGRVEMTANIDLSNYSGDGGGRARNDN